jgi:hypothetical protein
MYLVTVHAFAHLISSSGRTGSLAGGLIVPLSGLTSPGG